MRIFCIGLPKTGTSSLNEALKILGYESYHSETWVLEKILASEFYFRFDALTHSVERHYELFERLYENARFICTTRPYESWIVSVEKQLTKDVTESEWSKLRRIYSFGTHKFSEPVLHNVFDSHRIGMSRFARKLPKHRFCYMEISRGWRPLCDFLDRMIPNMPFPHLNKS